jgi:hypothetical protein
MFGIVEEANGVQSCPKSAKPVVFSVSLRSMRTQASLIEGWLERIEEMLRLLTRVKSPSKSNSMRPVIVVFGAGSSHSKFAPSRRPRARRWNSGEAFGPVSAASSGRGKSLPCGDEVS